jgi:sugar phosphate isomerase/epimerase
VNCRILFVIASTAMSAFAAIGRGAEIANARNAFFAMDTIARGGPAEVPALLKELGYDGLGGKALDEAMPPALTERGLKFFNGYYVANFTAENASPDEKLLRWFAAMRGYNTALWMAVRTLKRADGRAFAHSAADADDIVVARVRALADAAAPHGVRISLYPHTAQWLERVEDAIRVANKVDRANVGVTFNLCHWLRVEGSERDPAPVLRAALPRLQFVTINGADTGDTRALNWNQLIQPLDAGTYDVGGFVRLLRELNYRGPIGFQGYGIKTDPREVLERTMTAWRRMSAVPSAP